MAFLFGLVKGSYPKLAYIEPTLLTHSVKEMKLKWLPNIDPNLKAGLMGFLNLNFEK